MKGYLLGNLDIELYGGLEEFSALDGAKKSLSGKLQNVHAAGIERRFELKFDNSRDLIDGIEVKILPHEKDFRYVIKITPKALEEVRANGRWGSRYGGSGAKIILSTKNSPWERAAR